MPLTTNNPGTADSQPGIPHTFHIPVMGTGFTIDTPIRVAQYGISSVLQIGDDILIEHMRKHHSQKAGKKFTEIPSREDDSRARRITAYLNLLSDIVDQQMAVLRAEPFRKGTSITRYFEMLPDGPLRDEYLAMLDCAAVDEKKQRQEQLRTKIVPGSIDVNIMTKVDGPRFRGTEQLPEDECVAMSALRGFARSCLSSSIVLSAGMNRRLYAYMSEFDDFLPDDSGRVKKKIVLKVSDYRSALIQGKMLAQKGLWVSEFRVESGLNCGGHAFASKGHLLGPILDEFRTKKAELTDLLFGMFRKALDTSGRFYAPDPLPVRITVQGGIGTAVENEFLHKYFEVDGTGWGTPFLLVPEATNIDAHHLKKLLAAGEND
ncbi:MAG: hypothetical protein KKA42_12940, partial [candidate division Zixibacteria bacterium]|nr:hypothetical protein [candidate division Zixibacteria bacterium]